jgi:imidazolonepropionase-like amidohydrolase
MENKFHLSFLLLSIFISAAKAQSTDTMFYSQVTAGTISGEQKAWRIIDNEYNYSFKYNDRGRGPDQKTTIRLNKDGAISQLNISGIDYYKSPYQENFEIKGDSAVWKINGVSARAKFTGQFYNNGSQNQNPPGMDELLIKWLENKPGNKGEILPGGTIRASLLGTKTISYKGKSAGLKLYGVYHDTIPTPAFVWLDDKGHFFAEVDAWSGIIKKGFEAWTDTLNVLQVQQEEPLHLAEMKKYAADIPIELVIIHANIFHSESATVQKDMTVEVAGGKIKAIYPSQSNTGNFRGTVIDAKGKFLMPGLWDMHSHYFSNDGVWYVAGGVTHVRDMGNSKVLLTYKKQIASNYMLGPDLSYLSGFIDQKGLYQGPTGSIVASLAEGIDAIHEYHRLGYQQIKLYSSIDTAWVRPMCTEAHKLGMRVCGHIPAFMSAEQAIDDGYDEITHINFIFLNFMDRSIDTRTPLRFRKVDDEGGNLDLKSAQVTAFINKMKQKNISFDPTLNVFTSDVNDFKGDTVGSLKPVASWMPESQKSSLVVTTPFGSKEQEPRYRKTYQNILALTKLMYDNGILIVAGTDGGDAIALHHELEIYVQAGIPAAQALKIATYNAAKDCNMLSQAGQVKIGSDADLLLIDGNPIKNISDIRRVEWVIKNNKMYNPKQLLASQGWKYYY